MKEAYEDCEKALVYWTGPYVLLTETSRLGTSGRSARSFVFDWGDARADASPLDDVLHLMIQRRMKTVLLLCRAMSRAREFALAATPNGHGARR